MPATDAADQPMHRLPSHVALAGAQEVLPALVAFLARPQRAVAHHLLTQEEAATRSHLVDTMLDYGVTFSLSAAEQAGEGATDIVLSPPVHRVTLFEVPALS